MPLHRITYDGRENDLPCRCEECGLFAGYGNNDNEGYRHLFKEECPGRPAAKIKVGVTPPTPPSPGQQLTRWEIIRRFFSR